MNEFRLFRVALMYFTRIPVGEIKHFKAADIKHAARYFPWVGALIGLINAVIYMISVLIFDQSIAVLLAMTASFLLTGCLHEGGLADTIDGFLGGYNTQQKLEKIKDSRQSSYGVVALWASLTLKWLLLSRLDPVTVPLVLITGHTFSRFIPVLMIKVLTYVREEDHKDKPVAARITWRDIVMSSLIMLPIFVLSLTKSLIIIAVLLAGFLLFARMTKRQIGGYTGHVLGASQQMSELLVYIVWSALS
jgi:adenosylcobinamide-GDP ribazoletransferase